MLSPCESLSVCLSTWKNVVLETPGVVETTTKVVLSTLASVCGPRCLWIDFVMAIETVQGAALKLYRCVAEIQMKPRSVKGVSRELTEFAADLISSQSCF